jgi:hypothetical protein
MDSTIPTVGKGKIKGGVNLYVRCTDAAGRKNVQEYAINFCVSPEPDRTPPVISGFSPASPGYVSLNASSKNVKFFLNEPAECRWNEQDVAYNAMTHNATCAGELAEILLSIIGFLLITPILILKAMFER